MTSHRLSLGVALFFFISLLSYVLINIPSGISNTKVDYYPQYAKAIREGRLWLTTTNSLGSCPHDLSVFRGKCYVYWGIFPAIIHLIFPFLSDRFLALLAVALATYFLNRITIRIAQQCFLPKNSHETEFSFFQALPTCLAFTLASGFGVLGLAGRAYEESLIISIAMGLMGTHFVLPYLMGEQKDFGSSRIWLAVLSFIAAGHTRLPWFLCALVVGIILSVILFRSFKDREKIKQLNRLAGPALALVLGITLQLILNFSRFEKYFETGYSFQTTFSLMGPWLELHPGVFSIKYIPYNALMYWVTGYPQLFFEEGILLQKLMKHCYYREYPAGLLVWMPSILLIFFSSWKKLPRYFLLCIASILIPLALPVLTLSFQIFRYQWEAFAFWALPVSAIIIARNPSRLLPWVALIWTTRMTLIQWSDILTLLKDSL